MGKFWIKSSQHVKILLDKLMTYKVIDGASIVNWLFDYHNANSYHSHVWEVSVIYASNILFWPLKILTNTVNKTIARCDTLKRELAAARDAPAGRIILCHYFCTYFSFQKKYEHSNRPLNKLNENTKNCLLLFSNDSLQCCQSTFAIIPLKAFGTAPFWVTSRHLVEGETPPPPPLINLLFVRFFFFFDAHGVFSTLTKFVLLCPCWIHLFSPMRNLQLQQYLINLS